MTGFKEILRKAGAMLHRVPWCICANLLLLYIVYMVCRVTFVLDNYDMFGASLNFDVSRRILKGGLLFDTSAIFYTNIIYLLLVLVPWKKAENKVVYAAAKWVFIIVNSLAVVVNLADTVYFAFSEKRATLLMLDEFSGNTNGGIVVGHEIINHWYFVLLFATLVFILYKGYRSPEWNFSKITTRRYYVTKIVSLLVFVFITIAGIRGALFSTSSRPIAMSNAHQYVDKPTQAAIVVNTPFSVIRTAMKRQASVPVFFTDDAQVEDYFTAVHMPADSVMPDKRNVVILIVESFAEEFVGARNRDLDNGTYKGYTEFVDSLLPHCLTWEHTYANGWISIDAMPSVLSSLPKMYTSFVLTPYALDDVPGIAKQLGEWGYESAFFHGAENSSMGFQAFARSAGFDTYYGREEYYEDPNTGGKADFDGTWAIWDEEFLQYMCHKLGDMKQPFLASVFTATSHHPFALPERYRAVYPEEGTYPIHKCIRYTDNALRQFFAAAKTQPWYENTIFVITADHASSRVTHELYRTPEGDYRVPILFYDPSGRITTGNLPGIAQQIDIMPTLLGMLGYDRPYIAVGKDLMKTAPEDMWAFNWHDVPQYIKGDYLLQFNEFQLSGLYNLRADRMMKHNLALDDNYDHEYVDRMILELEALLQDTSTRMKRNKLRYSEPQDDK